MVQAACKVEKDNEKRHENKDETKDRTKDAGHEVDEKIEYQSSSEEEFDASKMNDLPTPLRTVLPDQVINLIQEVTMKRKRSRKHDIMEDCTYVDRRRAVKKSKYLTSPYDDAVYESTANMEDNVGRTRQGRASRAHSSARKELAANAPPPKRGRRGKQGPPVRGTHDVEAGGSGCFRSRARRPVRDDEDFDAEPNVQEESYPGGPSDLSLLKNYHKHRAIPIWDAQHNDPILSKSLRCIASANKVIKIQKPTQDWFWEYIIASGLEPLVRSNFNVLDYEVLWAFAERCHPETSTFHLPIGEIGITLDDVQYLLHISIQGKFLNHVKISRPDEAQMLSSYLGIDEGDALDMFATLKGPYLTHSYVQGLFMDYLDATETAFANNAPMHEVRMYRERCVRVFC
ncbi:hypothetical protein TSUD_376550 [Trifolium subterraneum]|uniref:Aminotransferase-like plant mobile domain-containing protein n=1 Tax=Trifolium subterraneum TaxID=3900 RepID=A0A2Z6NFC6_TRISU|nr:hypothetical protein TSUD_376550 [Trifolium subterraneum]